MVVTKPIIVASLTVVLTVVLSLPQPERAKVKPLSKSGDGGCCGKQIAVVEVNIDFGDKKNPPSTTPSTSTTHIGQTTPAAPTPTPGTTPPEPTTPPGTTPPIATTPPGTTPPIATTPPGPITPPETTPPAPTPTTEPSPSPTEAPSTRGTDWWWWTTLQIE